MSAATESAPALTYDSTVLRVQLNVATTNPDIIQRLTAALEQADLDVALDGTDQFVLADIVPLDGDDKPGEMAWWMVREPAEDEVERFPYVANTPFRRRESRGHEMRTGHVLTGYYTFEDGIATLTRTCCGE